MRFATSSEEGSRPSSWINARWDEYESLMRAARLWLGDLPADVARRVAWDNGAELFGLPQPAPLR